MIRKLAVTIAGTALLAGTAIGTEQADQEIQMWMGLTGLGGETLTKYGEEFHRCRTSTR